MCYSTVGTDDAETSALHIIVGGSPPGSEARAAPCAAGGLRASPSSGPRPSEASLPPPIPPRLPMAIRGLFKNIRPAQSPPSLGAPGTPRPGWLPSASPCAGQAAPARSCLGILVPCTLPAPQPGPSPSQGQSPSPPAMPFPRPDHCPSRLLRNARPQGQESARAAGHGIGDRAAAGGLRRVQAPARQAHGPPPSAPKRRSSGARSQGRATARAPPAASWVSVPCALTAKPPSPGGDAEGASPARSDASQASASRDSSRAPREQTPAPLPP